MILESLKLVVYGNNWFYSLLVMLSFASFIISILISTKRSYLIFKNSYYTYLFEKDLWNQSLEKNLDNARQWTEKSTLVKMFSEGFKLFISQYKKNNEYNSGSNIDLTKNTMKVVLKKEYENLNMGLNILSFNSYFIPYVFLFLSIFEIINIFSTVSLDVLSLAMFVKPLTLLIVGLLMTGITHVLYVGIKDRLLYEEDKLNLFIEEFGNFLHRNFYTGENK